MWSEMRARDPKLTRAPDPNSARRNQKERRILCVRADRGRGTFCAWRAARPPSKYARDFDLGCPPSGSTLLGCRSHSSLATSCIAHTVVVGTR